VQFSAVLPGEPGGPTLSGFLARPNFSAASGAGRHGVVLSHGFPETWHNAGSPSYGYPQLATRLAAETGAAVLTFDFRGTGGSQGDFSLAGWRADLAAAAQTLAGVPGIEKIWLVGFGAGGTLCICAAGEDPSIAGVAVFAAPAEFAEHGADTRRHAVQAKSSGVVPSRGYPPAPAEWARELKEVRPTRLVASIPPRPFLIVHGANDDIVPITDARELADAANETAELRILAGADHMLMHDPRAIALLLGWFDRHFGAAT
jgi:putative redox protein